MKRKSKYIGIFILIAALIAVIGYGIWYITVPTSDPEIIPKVEINYPDEEDEDGDGLKNQEQIWYIRTQMRMDWETMRKYMFIKQTRVKQIRIKMA